MNSDARFWNFIAKRYAKKPVPNEDVYRRKLELTQARLWPEAEVLELGCGTGTTAVHHAAHVRHLRAVDVSERMLEIARTRAREAGVENVSFERAEIAALPLPPESVDVVLALSILHLLPDWRGTIRRIHGALRPGGVFVSSTASLGDGMAWFRYLAPLGHAVGLMPDVQVFTADALRAEVRGAGFAVEEDWTGPDGRTLFLIARKSAA